VYKAGLILGKNKQINQHWAGGAVNVVSGKKLGITKLSLFLVKILP
jgi:hypothetical protein